MSKLKVQADWVLARACFLVADGCLLMVPSHSREQRDVKLARLPLRGHKSHPKGYTLEI